MRSFQFFIDNVQCEGCIENIKRELCRIDGVESIKICPNNCELLVSGKNIKCEEIENQLIMLGYPKRSDRIDAEAGKVIKRLRSWAAHQLSPTLV
jgi:copper chaperone CopZ